MSQAGIFSQAILPPGSVVETIQGNSGGPISPDGTNNIKIIGDGTTLTVTGDNITHELTISLVGGGTIAESFHTDLGANAVPVAGVLNIIAGNSTLNAGSSVLFSSPGAAPFNTVLLNVTDANNNTIIGFDSGNLPMSGANNTSLGAGNLINLTSGAFNTAIGSNVGAGLTSGDLNILMGSGAGALLTTSDSENTLIGNSGFAGAIEFVVVAAGAGGAPVLHNYPGTNASTTNGGNTFVGRNAGNFTLAGGAGNAGNNGVGAGNLSGLTTGARNNSMGAFALSELTTGNDNVVLGDAAGFILLSGAFNVLLGSSAGTSYASNESSNIIINSSGIVSESHVLRIGSGTGTGTQQLNKAFISGIDGINVGSTATIVTEVGNQLGTAVITAGTGVTITPGANLITISSSGTITLAYTNVNTTPYVVLVTDDYLSVDSSGGAITIQLPNAATLGKTYIIKDRTGSAAPLGPDNITVTTVGGAVLIDGATTYVIDTAYQAVSIIGNGVGYELY